MGKVYYRPNKNKREDRDKVALVGKENTGLNQEEKKELMGLVDNEVGGDILAFELLSKEEPIKEAKREINLDNVRAIGNVLCDYHIYIEDYVYTYLYQYAQMDLSKESAAVFVGRVLEESKEVIITGIIPLIEGRQGEEREWLGREALERAEEERIAYFGNQEMIGWMHMQPGYGTMLTMKELREHRSVFGEVGKVFMLLDPINKIETFFAQEEGELLEQSGYYMYYQRNEEMQQYMLEHPFKPKEAIETEDTVVKQFREIGKARKKEYLQRKNLNITVVATSLLLIAVTAVIVKMNDSKSITPTFNADVEQIKVNGEQKGSKEIGNTEAVEFTINPVEKQADGVEVNMEGLIPMQEGDVAENHALEEVKKSPIQGTQEVGEGIVKEPEQVIPEETKVSEEVTEKATEEVTEEGAKEDYEVYIIKEGDTLANIVFNKYGNSSRVKEVIALNHLSDTNLIKIGQQLKLPK